MTDLMEKARAAQELAKPFGGSLAQELRSLSEAVLSAGEELRGLADAVREGINLGADDALVAAIDRHFGPREARKPIEQWHVMRGDEMIVGCATLERAEHKMKAAERADPAGDYRIVHLREVVQGEEK